jgi:hypothetical protein
VQRTQDGNRARIWERTEGAHESPAEDWNGKGTVTREMMTGVLFASAASIAYCESSPRVPRRVLTDDLPRLAGGSSGSRFPAFFEEAFGVPVLPGELRRADCFRIRVRPPSASSQISCRCAKDRPFEGGQRKRFYTKPFMNFAICCCGRRSVSRDDKLSTHRHSVCASQPPVLAAGQHAAFKDAVEIIEQRKQHH